MVVVRCPYFSVHLKILEAVLEADRLIRVYEVSTMSWSTAATRAVLSVCADGGVFLGQMADMAPHEDGSLCRGLNLHLLQKVGREAAGGHVPRPWLSRVSCWTGEQVAVACSKLSWPVVGQAVVLDLLEEEAEEGEEGLLLLDPIDLSLPPSSTATLLTGRPTPRTPTWGRPILELSAHAVPTEPDCPALCGWEGRCLRQLVEWNLPLLLHRVPLKTLTQTMGLLLCEVSRGPGAWGSECKLGPDQRRDHSLFC